MARQPVQPSDGEEPGDGEQAGNLSETSEFTLADADGADDESGGDTGRTAETDAFWERVRIDPIEIAMNEGVGYTLRAYRLRSEITPTDFSEREPENEFHDYPGRPADDEPDDEFGDLVAEDLDDDAAIESDVLEAEDDDSDTEDEDAEMAEPEDEEVPLFLSHRGQLLLFRSAESLVEFVRTDENHDLAQLDNWTEFAAEVQPSQINPLPDDSYELDLVVTNLRAGHDAWEPELIVNSGQLARDIAHALHLESVVLAMTPGTPLDNLDEALRGVAAGGVGAFFARRKAKKIGTETASLGWRTMIGKISAVVDWRD